MGETKNSEKKLWGVTFRETTFGQGKKQGAGQGAAQELGDTPISSGAETGAKPWICVWWFEMFLKWTVGAEAKGFQQFYTRFMSNTSGAGFDHYRGGRLWRGSVRNGSSVLAENLLLSLHYNILSTKAQRWPRCILLFYTLLSWTVGSAVQMYHQCFWGRISAYDVTRIWLQSSYYRL